MGTAKWMMAAALLTAGSQVLRAGDEEQEVKRAVVKAVVVAEQAAAEGQEAAEQVADEVKSAAAQVKKEAEQAYQEAAEAALKAAKEARHAAEEAAKEARDVAEEAAKDAREQAERAYEQAVEQATKAREQAYRQFKQHVAAAKQKDGYRLQISVVPVPRSLDAQLKLDGTGLLVDRVGKGGPADKAGVEVHDIFLTVSDKPIKKPEVLLEAVEKSEGKDLQVEVLRAGKPLTLVIAPAEAPKEEEIEEEFEFSFPTGKLNVELRDLEKKIREKLKDAGVDVRMQLIRPGHLQASGNVVIQSAAPAEFPADLKVEISKEGPKPAEITVTRGDETWTVTEGELDKLPDDVRPHVAGLLGKRPVRFAIAGPKGATQTLETGTIELSPGTTPQTRERLQGRLERRLDELSRDFDRMHKQLNELRGTLQNEFPELKR